MAYKVVKIGDKEIPMLAMASINIYYKRIFGDDPLKIQTAKDFDAADGVNLYMQLGFVMAMFAQYKGSRKDMQVLTEDRYLDWLDDLDYLDYVTAVPEIAALYQGQQDVTSHEKKRDG